jgi:D-glycero-alpha-D-manno-heptose-7-phosphate kinase
MIITQTPFRISFFGGGTDYRPYFDEHGGSVLSTTFDKYCYVTVRRLLPFFSYKNEITYAKIERTAGVDEIEHPAVREAMKFLGMRELRVAYEADLPAHSGLGSSSAFAVSLLEALYALRGMQRSKRQLAEDAIHLERELCGESGGWQDQIAVAYGGFNRINFSRDGFTVNPVILSRERKKELNNSLMLFFTGLSRYSGSIAKNQIDTMSGKMQELAEIQRLVDEGERILISGDNINEFGMLLEDAWRLKRGLSSRISSDYIDAIYQKARDHGALGGKIMGAGGGGFLILFVPPERQREVRECLSDLLYVPFEFETMGTRILYYAPEQ